MITEVTTTRYRGGNIGWLKNSLFEILSYAIPNGVHSCTLTPRNKNIKKPATNLVEALGRRHGSLDGKASNVLPALLQQRDQVVDGKHDVANKLLLLHTDVADGDTHAENLLELELDGGLDLVDLASQVVGVGDGSRELSGCRRKNISIDVACM